MIFSYLTDVELLLSVVIGCTDSKAQNITSDSVIPSALSETKGGRKLEQLFQLRIFAVGGGVSDNGLQLYLVADYEARTFNYKQN